MIGKVFAELERNAEASLDQLFNLISIPSISGEESGKDGVREAAEWLRSAIDAMGLEAQIVETAGHPVVLARSEANGGPRILFYGHYDVLPATPLNGWTRAPFSPALEGNVFYGRGASDSKSQLWTFLEALRAWKTVHGNFPGEIIVMLEGEEECGSPSLGAFLDKHRKDVACDVAFICDSDMWGPEEPAITMGLKGLLHEKVTILSPHPDLHSGHYGAVAANPIRILSGILAALHCADGRVAIPGFYDDIEAPSARIRTAWNDLAADPGVLSGVDIRGGSPEEGWTVIEAMWGRPTVDINGITGGNQGPGERSVLPAEATARLSFRLVAGQEPAAIRDGFRAFIQTLIPEGCAVSFEGEGGSRAVALSDDSPYLGAMSTALRDEWGRAPVLKATGGAIPVVGDLRYGLGVDCIVVGFILASDAIHAPDENYDLTRLRKGARTWVRLLAEIRNLGAP